MNEGVEWAIHCAALMAATPADIAVPMSVLAEFHAVPPSYLAKVLQSLAKAQIVMSSTGRHGGYRLARPASDITLLDIVMAVDGEDGAFRCTEVRKRGPSAVEGSLYTPCCGIAAAMGRAEDAWRDALRNTTVADIVEMTFRDSPPVSLQKGITWVGNKLAARSS